MFKQFKLCSSMCVKDAIVQNVDDNGPIVDKDVLLLNVLTELSGGMKKLNEGVGNLLRKQARPENIYSGTYFDTIDDVLKFDLESCKNVPAQRDDIPSYVPALLTSKILEYEQKKLEEEEKKEKEDAKKKGSTTPQTKNGISSPTHQIPIVDDNGSVTSGLSNTSSKRSRRSMRERQKAADSQTTGTRNTDSGDDRGRKGKHIFGGARPGEVKCSNAHLIPKSHICQQFYENSLRSSCGPYTKHPIFKDAVTKFGKTGATMIFTRAMSDSAMNKIDLPIDHASFFDEEMKEGTVLIIPIMTREEAHKWEKGEGYSVLIVADSAKSYRYCDMDVMLMTSEATPVEVSIAATFLADATKNLAHSLTTDNFEALTDPKRTDRFDKDKDQNHFEKKVKSTEQLRDMIKNKDHQVLIPMLKKNEAGEQKSVRLLKIDLASMASGRRPNPVYLVNKASICAHKYAGKSNYSKYASERFPEKDCEAYVKETDSMMLLPACGKPPEDPVFHQDDGDVASQEEGSSMFDSLESSWDCNGDIDTEFVGRQTIPKEIRVTTIVTPEKK
mmetsp:Transcript_46788/g.53098  ORF Transcript_46788/g.53098 Transcript_46788/m.53098 type:complete len:557 (-) Transcript_46788:257-1927(-)